MFAQVGELIGRIVRTAPSVIGCRAGTEEPPYRVEPLIDGVEIRHYGPRIAAATTVSADPDAALQVGFGRLAGYIFGDNHSEESSAPEGGAQKIAMTAPVAQTGGTDDSWDIQFYMPAKWTLDGLPEPNDERVRLVTLPAQAVAVLRFSGDRGRQAVAANTERLREVLRATGFEDLGEPTAWFYDPPWTVPFLRRNEIAIPIGQ